MPINSNNHEVNDHNLLSDENSADELFVENPYIESCFNKFSWENFAEEESVKECLDTNVRENDIFCLDDYFHLQGSLFSWDGSCPTEEKDSTEAKDELFLSKTKSTSIEKSEEDVSNSSKEVIEEINNTSFIANVPGKEDNTYPKESQKFVKKGSN